MEVRPFCLSVADSSHVGEVRRAASSCARALAFDETDVGRVALVATEAASNLVKHTSGGLVLVRPGPTDAGEGARGVEVVAIDRGPGMASVDACVVDGYSTAGSPGTGLGALRRVSNQFDIYSRPGHGTVLLALVTPARWQWDRDTRLTAGEVSTPSPGEEVCGDRWAVRHTADATTVVVADGLGHGPLAAEAAQAAVAQLRDGEARAPADLMRTMHEAIRHTRGAAVAVARVDTQSASVLFCGIGNISAVVSDGPSVRHLVSQHGIVGREVRRVQEFRYPWTAGAMLVLHSDGVGTRWKLDEYPGLAERHPSVVAGVIHRDHVRHRDDATVMVVRARAIASA